MSRWLLLVACVLALAGCSRSAQKYVVLYTSQDQFYAEPILKEFTASTGIEVRPVFDTESAKTAGLAHRLHAEASNSQCDVFWSNEEMHTRLLVRDGIVGELDWQKAGARTRRIVINTNLVSRSQIPASVHELTNRVWRGRLAIAYPLFGTTKSHFVALRQLWGEDAWKNWCQELVRNEVKVVDGNSVVVKLVGAGECAIGLTDSDDIAAGIKEGMPIAALESNSECLLIPSTVALVRGAPHPQTAQSLIEYLSKQEVIEKLVAVGALESVYASGKNVSILTIDWTAGLKDVDSATDFLERIFVRS